MAQFVLKIEKLSHIMGPTPILEMARAYGLRPRFWLLPDVNICKDRHDKIEVPDPLAVEDLMSCKLNNKRN